MRPTPRLQKIESALGEPIYAWLRNRREGDNPLLWRQIVHEIKQKTEIDVTDEALRVWYLAASADAEASTAP